jgi:hypothetical protein
MTKPFRGVINVDVTQSVPDWEPYTQPIAPERRRQGLARGGHGTAVGLPDRR